MILQLFGDPSIPSQNIYTGLRGGISIPTLTSGGSNENPLNTGRFPAPYDYAVHFPQDTARTYFYADFKNEAKLNDLNNF